MAATKAAASRVRVELCIVEGVDYGLLFPRVSTIVRHGGLAPPV